MVLVCVYHWDHPRCSCLVLSIIGTSAHIVDPFVNQYITLGPFQLQYFKCHEEVVVAQEKSWLLLGTQLVVSFILWHPAAGVRCLGELSRGRLQAVVPCSSPRSCFTTAAPVGLLALLDRNLLEAGFGVCLPRLSERSTHFLGFSLAIVQPMTVSGYRLRVARCIVLTPVNL